MIMRSSPWTWPWAGCPQDTGTMLPAGIKVADADFDGINLHRHDVHGDWNYTIAPRGDP